MIAYLRRRRDTRRLADDWRVLYGLRDGGQHFAYDASRSIHLRSGRMYPALTRLLDQGLVSDGWEDQPIGRPARRWYRLTERGRAAVRVGVIEP